ncbi:MAG TPA: OsmC family protein [Candidatus Eremiobacteraceae bacterium]|nr:OsmC family protein [Candidatus Eremiobacteraceae bacterium]
MKLHRYAIQVEWTGDDGEGTRSYRGYRRDHTIESAGKPKLLASSDPAFRGDPTRYNPEELFVASLSSCHMLWYLHLCSVNKVVVVGYHDAASGEMEERQDGSGVFTRVTLRPVVKIADGDPDTARALHEEAHRYCFIANSVKFPVEIEPQITTELAPR